MTFRGFIYLFILVLSPHLVSASIESYPLGLILRPSLFQRYFDAINKNQRGISVSACENNTNTFIDGKIHLKLSEPRWINSSARGMQLSASLDEMTAILSAYKSCSQVNRKTSYGSVETSLPEKVEIQLFLNPWNIHRHENTEQSVEFHQDSLRRFAKALKIQLVGHYPNINKELDSLSFRESFVGILVKQLELEIHEWLESRLRGLAYVDYLSNMFKSNSNWKEGVQIEKGAISLTNPGDRLRQSELAFGFYPRRSQFVVPGQSALELYFNAVFLDRNQMEDLASSNENSEMEKLSLARDRLLVDPSFQDADFTRPLVRYQESDATLILPENLVNGALTRLYQQDLRQFTTTISFGKQAKGVVVKDEADVSIRVELESKEAPRILFQSNRFNLSVSNYFLSIGTFIEDRLIPSTQVQAQVDISAKFDIKDSHVNLSVQPETFNIDLDKGKRFRNQFSASDLDFIENISNDLWKEFFKKYPRLPLFYTIFKATDSKIEITDLKVQNDMILIHFNFHEVDIKL